MAGATVTRAVLWVGGLVVGAFVLVGLLSARQVKAAAAPERPVPKPGGSSTEFVGNPYAGSEALEARVQQERKDELAQWQIVQRSATRVIQSGLDTRTYPMAQARRDLALATSKIAGLEREIAAHGG